MSIFPMRRRNGRHPMPDNTLDKLIREANARAGGLPIVGENKKLPPLQVEVNHTANVVGLKFNQVAMPPLYPLSPTLARQLAKALEHEAEAAEEQAKAEALAALQKGDEL